MESSSSSSRGVPESTIEAVERTLANLKLVETHLLEFLSRANPDVLDEMPPLQRAQSLFMFAKATTTIFALRLRTTGIHPDEHLLKTELERLSLYQDKLEQFINTSKEPSRRSTTLNYQAATRFIEHSLPELTPEQRKSMRDISRGEGSKIKYMERSTHKKRKYDTSEKQSVKAAAQEFLEKAARELFGGNTDGFKGPLIKVDSSSEDEPVE
ncbi:SUN-COR STEROID HORMONE RECEPTOR CO-REPRESSOR [Salix koriyanagi]|uniref:Nuclear nucleic acid-binding protein C1D n=1 Tax=Salix koriyanagi TaxID=2511006 RepID=A0A9Q0W438_9ROSI|nr:SUN-COR STEROID HORMONE RECEPTOR CO-REPRESSOR [Salix koriyanagi]KAJ6758681.1 SUN-COR STEROID HORMONE RECEPTOR CO-REPRESSOR [Salix koriyanagi]